MPKNKSQPPIENQNDSGTVEEIQLDTDEHR